MKITCDIIEDLLPLYAEELASEDSRALVEEHLADCSSCRAALSTMKQATPPLPEDALPLANVQKTLKGRRWATAVLAAALVLAVALGVFSRLTEPIYLPYVEDSITLSEEQSGGFSWSHADATGYTIERGISYVDGGSSDVFLMAWQTPLDVMLGRTAGFISLPADADNIYYTMASQDGTYSETTLLWSRTGDNDWDGTSMGVEVMARLVLGYYVLIAFFTAAGLLLLRLVLRKTKAAPVVRALFWLPVSYLLGHFCVKGINTMTFSPVRDFVFIVLIGAAIYAAILSAGWLRRAQKKI